MTTFEEQLKNALSHAYDIERELGGGGMSRVFVATERSLGRKVVIKVLSPELTAEVNRGRFRREIQVAAQLQHPHIVTLLSAGEDGELVYYTMPFIRGESLKSAIEKDGAMSVAEVVRVLYDVTDALAYAHENGVVHRDIKPANILKSGAHALVTDFGVAKALDAAMGTSGAMTSTGMAIGTPAYMSPEQLAGDPAADHRIDIYALGLLAYELLTGKSPFAASNPRLVLAAVLTTEPQPLSEVRPDVPRPLSEIVMRCLSKEPEGRPQTAGALMSALDQFSTASGEIRTQEHRVRRIGSTTLVASLEPTVPTDHSSVTPGEQTIPVGENTAADQIPTDEPARPNNRRKPMLIGGLALLVPVVAGAFFLTRRTVEKPLPATAPPVNVAVVDSASKQPLNVAIQPVPAAVQSVSAPVQPAPAAVPASNVAVLPVDARARADSAKARAIRAEAAKKLTAAKAESAERKVEPGRVVRSARWAAAALMADATARDSFIRGASRSRKKGDLQTQIDALQPFLSKFGLTYDQFKVVVRDAGFNIFDEFGRMVPDSMKHFAVSAN